MSAVDWSDDELAELNGSAPADVRISPNTARRWMPLMSLTSPLLGFGSTTRDTRAVCVPKDQEAGSVWQIGAVYTESGLVA